MNELGGIVKSFSSSLNRRRNSRALAVSMESLSSANVIQSKKADRTEASSKGRPAKSDVRKAPVKGKGLATSPPEGKKTAAVSETPAEEGLPNISTGRRRGRDRNTKQHPDESNLNNPASQTADSLSSASTPVESAHSSASNILRSLATGEVYHLAEGVKLEKLDAKTAVPVLEHRLSFQAAGSKPKEQEGVHFFSWNSITIKYFPFRSDFGPFNLGQTHQFCDVLSALFADPKLASKRLVMYCCSTEQTDLTNGIFLLGAFLCLRLGATAQEAWAPFANIRNCPCTPFRDATWDHASNYDLHVTDCWGGLLKAVKGGLYSPTAFVKDEYFYYDNPKNGDMHEVVKDKFLAFKGPSERRQPLGNGVFSFLPTDYSAVFQAKGVRTVVRLNREKEYDRGWLVNQGYHLHDLPVGDCEAPPDAVVDRFLRIAEASKTPIAVHCKTGLGPTPTLIALYMMKHFDFSAREAVGWLRVCRPGSVLGPQQPWLEAQEQRMKSLGVARLQGLGLDHASGAVATATGGSGGHPDAAAASRLEAMVVAAVEKRTLARIQRRAGDEEAAAPRPKAESSEEHAGGGSAEAEGARGGALAAGAGGEEGAGSGTDPVRRAEGRKGLSKARARLSMLRQWTSDSGLRNVVDTLEKAGVASAGAGAEAPVEAARGRGTGAAGPRDAARGSGGAAPSPTAAPLAPSLRRAATDPLAASSLPGVQPVRSVRTPEGHSKASAGGLAKGKGGEDGGQEPEVGAGKSLRPKKRVTGKVGFGVSEVSVYKNWLRDSTDSATAPHPA